MHWYKRDPDAALAGMAELNFEQRGAYNSILDILYSRDGDLPDNDCVVARSAGTSGHTTQGQCPDMAVPLFWGV
jgi:Protein of unknown function (DUF1376)